jgi:hypothetical protein
MRDGQDSTPPAEDQAVAAEASQKKRGEQEASETEEAWPMNMVSHIEKLEEAVRALPGFTLPLDDEAAREELREDLCDRVLWNLMSLGVEENIAALLVESAFTPTFHKVVDFHKNAGHC